jgi:hypothetical protein
MTNKVGAIRHLCWTLSLERVRALDPSMSNKDACLRYLVRAAHSCHFTLAALLASRSASHGSAPLMNGPATTVPIGSLPTTITYSRPGAIAGGSSAWQLAHSWTTAAPTITGPL